MTGRTTGRCLAYSLSAWGFGLGCTQSPSALVPHQGRCLGEGARGDLSIPFDWLRGPDLLGGGAPDYLDEIVQPYLAGEGGLHLIGA